MTISKAT